MTTKKTTKPTPKPETPQLIRVRAKAAYSNGTLETYWQPMEIRLIEAWKLRRLENDLPGNWEVLSD